MSYTDSNMANDRLGAFIVGLEAKLAEARATIESMLFSLELQEKVQWSELLEKFTSVAHELSTIQAFVKRASVFPSGEDGAEFLRRQVVVPKTIRPDGDPELAEMTNGRVPLWNHDTVPLMLRTKLDPEVEEEEQSYESSYTGEEKAARQINTMMKNIDQLIVYLNDPASSTNSSSTRPQLRYKSAETERLVRAVTNGEGLKPTSKGHANTYDYGSRGGNSFGKQ